MACVGCAGALIVAGCSGSSGDDTSDPSPEGGAGFPDAGPSHDGSIDSASDATIDAAHLDSSVDSSPSTDSSVTPDSMTASDSSSTPDGDDGGDAAVADGSPEAGGDDGGDAGIVLPAAVAIWDFQDTPGSTTAADSSGRGHTATLHGSAAIIAGPIPDAGASDGGADGGIGAYGNYLQIDGTAGAFADVTGGPLFDNSQSFSVSTWVYFPSLDNNYDELISADGAHVSVFELQLAPLTHGTTTYNSEAAFPTDDTPTPGNFYYAFSTAQPSVSTWYHIVGVYDLSTNPGLLSLYVNGVLQANGGDSSALGANPVAAVGDFIIGAGKYNDTRTNGAVANYVGVRVYDKALTAAQVVALYGLNGR